MTTRRALLGGAAGLGVLALAGCSSSDAGQPGGADGPPTAWSRGPSATASPRTDPVAVRAVLTGPLRIGVVVSLTSAPGEGSAWAPGAEGAQVAAHRLRRGGAEVTVVAANDKGTTRGIQRAVDQLADAGAAAVVVATTGSHVAAAAPAAARRGLSLVFCHPVPSRWLVDGVHCIAPLQHQVDEALAEAAGGRPVMVDAGGGLPTVGRYRAVLRCGQQGLSPAQLHQLAATRPGAVQVSGDAEALAAVARSVQGAALQVPVLLGPQARSPRFAAALASSRASLGQDLVTAGLATDDPTALTTGEAGQAVADYLAAVRDAAAAGGTHSFFDELPFDRVAWAADAASHDAVVAVACAAALAASNDPRRVAGRLSRVALGRRDGLVGPGFDLARARAGHPGGGAVDSSDVVVLHASTQDPGLRPRPARDTARLWWFAGS